MAFATKYRLEFDEIKTNPSNMATSYTPISWKLEILEDAFAGTVTNLTGGSNPLKINYDKIDLYDTWVMASSCTITIIATSTLQFTEFVTAQEDDYRVDLYRDGVLFWQGFINPGDYEEDYTESTNFEVQLKATDGLNKLESSNYSGGSSSDVLLTTVQALNSASGLTLSIVENIDMYEDRMAKTAADSPLKQALIEQSAIADEDRVYWTSLQYIEAICKAYGAVVFQKDGYWHLKRICLNDGGTYTERIYNSSGVYQSNTTGVNPVLEITGNGNSQIRIQSKLILQRATKTTTIINDGATRFNYIDDGVFSLWKSTSELSRWVKTAGMTYTRVSMKLGYALQITSSSFLITGDSITSAPVWVEEGSTYDFRFKYKMSVTGSGTSPQFGYRISISDEKGQLYYYNGATWSILTMLTVTTSSSQFDSFQEVKTTINAVPFSGYIKIQIHEPDTNGYTLTGLYLTNMTMQLETGNSTTEMTRFKGETTDTAGDLKEVIMDIGDRGGTALSRYTNSCTLATIVVRIDFGAIVNLDTFSIDIAETTRTFQYVSIGAIPPEFSTAADLVDAIKNYVTSEEYSVWAQVVAGSTYDIYVKANFYSSETGRNYAFNYADTSAAINKQSETTNVNPLGVSTSVDLRLMVGDNIAGKWSDGTVEGGMMDILQQYIHNQYGRVWQRHKGKLHDFTKNHTVSSVIHDATHNNGRYFMFVGGTLNCIEGIMDGEWHEVYTGTKAFTKTIENIK